MIVHSITLLTIATVMRFFCLHGTALLKEMENEP